MQRQEVFVHSRPPDLIFRPLLAGSLSQKHYTTRCRRAVGQSVFWSCANSYPNWSLAWWDFVWAARGVLGYRRAGQRNGAGVSPTDWKGCTREGGGGWWCVSEVTLGTSQNQKHVLFFFYHHCFFFAKKKKNYKKKRFVGKLWKSSLSVHAALHASPRLSSVGAKKPFAEVLCGARTWRPCQPVGKNGFEGKPSG